MGLPQTRCIVCRSFPRVCVQAREETVPVVINKCRKWFLREDILQFDQNIKNTKYCICWWFSINYRSDYVSQSGKSGHTESFPAPNIVKTPTSGIIYDIKSPRLLHMYWLVICSRRKGAEGREEKWEEVEQMSVQHARALSPSLITAPSIPRSLLVSVTLHQLCDGTERLQRGRALAPGFFTSFSIPSWGRKSIPLFRPRSLFSVLDYDPGAPGAHFLPCSGAFACLRLDGCVWDLQAQRQWWITMKGGHHQRGCGCHHLFTKLISKCGCCVGQGRGMHMDSLWLSSMFSWSCFFFVAHFRR